ncbi:hypothetical protein M231_05394 [Tremella mesenterica]|uniref:Uncharacterized protein n=2 Tax=Tremella mesenterica TaxID=5217 RepID=A0A4Q1BI59_TREME|nr:hypothetical protein M231_05394 [Tremella mesenterica]
MVLYGLLAIALWYRFFTQGRHKWMLSVTIGATTMAIGFAIRIAVHTNAYSTGIYIATYLFTLLSPCAYLAQDYVILPRVASYLQSEDSLFLSSRKIVRIFVWSDVATFLTQAAGGSLELSDSDDPSKRNLITIGKDITLVGLGAQLASFLLFTTLALVFTFRMRKRDAAGDPRLPPKEGWRNDWRLVLYVLLWTTIGILIRSAYRVAEYASGRFGYLMTHEWPFYALDSLPLFLAILPWAVVWPPQHLSLGNGHEVIEGTNGNGVEMMPSYGGSGVKV